MQKISLTVNCVAEQLLQGNTSGVEISNLHDITIVVQGRPFVIFSLWQSLILSQLIYSNK